MSDEQPSPEMQDVLSRLQDLTGPTASGAYLAVCPFHGDERPQLGLHPNTGYMCFGGCTGSLADLKERLVGLHGGEQSQITPTGDSGMNERFPAGVMTPTGLKVIAEQEAARGWVLEGILRRGSLAMLAAPPKTGKSTWALDLAIAVFQGTAFLDRATTKGQVLYIQAEDAPDVTWERVAKMTDQEADKMTNQEVKDDADGK